MNFFFFSRASNVIPKSRKMTIFILFFFLALVRSSLSLSFESIVDQGKSTLDAATGPIVEGMNETRYNQEIANMPSGLGIYGDDGQFHEITDQEDNSTTYSGEIIFKLYTYKNPTDGQDLRINDTASLENSNLDVSKITYMITHGWMNNGSSESCVVIRDAYVANTDYNVIVIDWSEYSLTINYIDAASKTQVAAQEVAKMIKFLYRYGIDRTKLNLVGHSLGAHVVGIAGYIVQPDEVDHVVALDPALPMFNFADQSNSVTISDARRVQMIHTNAGGLGYICAHGHTDFYPNGGSAQAGCCNDANIIGCADCSHGRAYKYFAESITRTFNATRCSSYERFNTNRCGTPTEYGPMGGLDLDAAKDGKYYLRTGEDEPYSEPEESSSTLPHVVPFFGNAFCRTARLVT